MIMSATGLASDHYQLHFLAIQCVFMGKIAGLSGEGVVVIWLSLGLL